MYQCLIPDCQRPIYRAGRCASHFGAWINKRNKIPFQSLCPNPFIEPDFITITHIPIFSTQLGVYKLYWKHTLIYVGQSTHIWRRIAKHAYSNEITFDQAEVYMEENLILRSVWESWLIWKYDPLKNKVRLNLPVIMSDEAVWKIFEKRKRHVERWRYNGRRLKDEE